MLFSSGEFIFLFLPISLIGFQLLSRLGTPAMLSWLAFMSLCFYAYWNPIYLLLLCGSILGNYLFAFPLSRRTGSEHARSVWLAISITANIALLVWFKYLFPSLNFFHDKGLLPHPFANVVLPLGISFFTFTQIAYLIDLRQDVAERQNLLTYTVFVTFFPHLIAGPIIHPREIMPQLAPGRLRSLKAENLALGFSWFIMGFAKKVFADRIAAPANSLYEAPAKYGAQHAWLGAVAYMMQLYFDFSGYTDMALGLARMFGIVFPINFNSPYKSPNVIEYWQRWHMTLTRYLGEGLYTPFLRSVNSRRMDAGKKVSKKAQATPGGFLQMVFFPVFTTMFIAGIWHGAGLQFLVFGSLHGIYLVINHAWRLFTPKGHRLHGKLPTPVSILLTFSAVLLGSVYFRANSVTDGNRVVANLLGLHGVGVPGNTTHKFTLLAFALFVVWALPNTQEILGTLPHDSDPLPSLLPNLRWRPTAVWSLGLAVVVCLSLLFVGTSTNFLYFQF